MQEIIVYICLGLALIYLVWKFFLNKKKDDGCGPECNKC
ncbi:MAG: FeoB-associated Cys-rich membrane protein [Flavobacteriaceae bacterium]|nr:FeoB-associated Cys-rich membrane protein [Flavobacteriaceae bacterium]